MFYAFPIIPPEKPVKPIWDCVFEVLERQIKALSQALAGGKAFSSMFLGLSEVMGGEMIHFCFGIFGVSGYPHHYFRDSLLSIFRVFHKNPSIWGLPPCLRKPLGMIIKTRRTPALHSRAGSPSLQLDGGAAEIRMEWSYVLHMLRS